MMPAPIIELDGEAMLRHLRTVFLGDFDGAIDGLVELAWTDTDARGALANAAQFGTHQLEDLAERAVALNRTPGCNVYVGAALRRPETPASKRGSDADFHSAPYAWADVDEDVVGAAIERCRSGGAMAHMTVVTGRRPHTRAQLWWRLAEAGRDPAAHRALCGALARAVGGDPTIVNPGRVMRLGGSVAWPRKPERVLERTEVHIPKDGRASAYWPAFLLEKLGAADMLSPPPSPNPGALEKPEAKNKGRLEKAYEGCQYRH